MIVERTLRIERALIHTRVDPGAREKVHGSHSTEHYFLARIEATNKRRQLLSKGTPAVLSPPSLLYLPRLLLLLLGGPAAALINSIHRRRDSWLAIALVGSSNIHIYIYISVVLSPSSDSLGSIFKVSNELWMIHGLAGLEFGP